MSDEPKPSTPPDDDLDELPIQRDYTFLFRLIGALVIGVLVAGLIGWKLQSSAASCGSNLIRPGGNVIPPAQPSSPPPPASNTPSH